MNHESILSLECPPTAWEDGLPIGTGRVMGMIWGTENEDRITLNHERLWTSLYEHRRNPSLSGFLPEIRRLLEERQWVEAARLVNDRFVPYGGTSDLPPHIDSFQPAGELCCRFSTTSSDYVRQLDMRRGVVEVRSGGVLRHYRADLAADLLLARFSSEEAFSCQIVLPEDVEVRWISERELRLTGKVAGGRHYAISLRFDGDAMSGSDSSKCLLFKDIDKLEWQVNIGVGNQSSEAESEAELPVKVPVFEDIASHESLMADWWNRSAEIALDPDLGAETRQAQLYYDLARYLMISCSACGSLPCNLQGKWNADPQPPWRSDFHGNINLQMNYWMVNPAGMSCCNRQLFNLVEAAIPAGRQAARDLFGCRGIWFPMAFDTSGCATPQGHGWGIWIGAAPWLAKHFRDYYDYTGDREFLRREAYPLLRECCEFFEDFLVRDAEGILHVSPSQSPENSFVGGGTPVSMCVDSTVDIELVAEVLESAATSARELEVDQDKVALWTDMRQRLPQLPIGSDGRLQEWNEPFEEVQPGHRHLSHLYGLYPGNLIDAERTPALYRAAGLSLDFRLAHDGGPTGWSRAWATCLYTALHEGNKAWRELKKLIQNQSSESMLDLHPPRVFQIDGNFGGAAAMLGMLLRSEHGIIELLPALPDEWSAGAVRNIHAKGGFTLTLTWRENLPEELEISCDLSERPCVLKTAGKVTAVCGDSGRNVPFQLEPGGYVRFIHPGRGSVCQVVFVRHQ